VLDHRHSAKIFIFLRKIFTERQITGPRQRFLLFFFKKILCRDRRHSTKIILFFLKKKLFFAECCTGWHTAKIIFIFYKKIFLCRVPYRVALGKEHFYFYFYF